MGKGSRGSREQGPTSEPDLPLSDELGFETVAYKCWACGRGGYMSANYAEALTRNGHKLFCLPHARPDLFDWEVEELPDGSKREFIRPKSAKEMLKHLSPEARELAAKRATLQIMRDRKEAILQMTTQLEVEFLGLLDAIDAAEKDVLELDIKCQALEQGDIGKKVESVKELTARIAALTYEIDKAKQDNARKGGPTQ